MRSLALLCLLAFATAAHAATPEQHYLDLRDRYIAKFSKAKESDETYEQHDAALNELTGVLRGLVGPTEPELVRDRREEGTEAAGAAAVALEPAAVIPPVAIKRPASGGRAWRAGCFLARIQLQIDSL